MDKETYKVALEIINRFGDKTTPLRPQLTTGLYFKKKTNQKKKSFH